MDKSTSTINPGGRWAPLTNVALCARAVERAMNRAPNLPGLVCLSGFSGYGKSHAASYCANKFEGIYVECCSYFTKKNLVEAILHEMGVKPGRTLSDMMGQAAEQLELSQRPLILDNFDYIADRKAVGIMLDLHEQARATILLVGEERLPAKLREWERVHRRVLVWQLAQPATPDDAEKLAEFYCPGVAIAEDLLERVCHVSRHTPGRICVNLDRIRDHCQTHGLKKINLDDWGKREIYSGEPPARRPV